MGAWMWEDAHEQSSVGDREVKVRRGGGGDGGGRVIQKPLRGPQTG